MALAARHDDVVMTPSSYRDVIGVAPTPCLHQIVTTPSPRGDVILAAPSSPRGFVTAPSSHGDVIVTAPSSHCDVIVKAPSSHGDIIAPAPWPPRGVKAKTPHPPPSALRPSSGPNRAHFLTSLPSSLSLSLLLFSSILSSFASLCTIAVPPDPHKLAALKAVSSAANRGGDRGVPVHSFNSRGNEASWTSSAKHQVNIRNNIYNINNKKAAKSKKLAMGRELFSHLQALEHYQNLTKLLIETPSRGNINYKLFLPIRDVLRPVEQHNQNRISTELQGYRLVLPIFGREGDYESMTSGDQDAALDPDKEDPFTTQLEGPNAELLRKLTVRLQRLQRRLFKLLKEYAVDMKEDRISPQHAHRLLTHDLDTCQTALGSRHALLAAISKNFTHLSAYMQRISDENLAVRKQAGEKEAQISKLYDQVEALKQEKLKMERRLSAKNEEIVNLTYDHENNKERIR